MGAGRGRKTLGMPGGEEVAGGGGWRGKEIWAAWREEGDPPTVLYNRIIQSSIIQGSMWHHAGIDRASFRYRSRILTAYCKSGLILVCPSPCQSLSKQKINQSVITSTSTHILYTRADFHFFTRDRDNPWCDSPGQSGAMLARVILLLDKLCSMRQ